MWLALASLLVACLLVPLGVLLVWSRPGTPRAFLDAEGRRIAGSIAQKIRVNIKGSTRG